MGRGISGFYLLSWRQLILLIMSGRSCFSVEDIYTRTDIMLFVSVVYGVRTISTLLWPKSTENSDVKLKLAIDKTRDFEGKPDDIEAT